jgi:hypothetical protein
MVAHKVDHICAGGISSPDIIELNSSASAAWRFSKSLFFLRFFVPGTAAAVVTAPARITAAAAPTTTVAASSDIQLVQCRRRAIFVSRCYQRLLPCAAAIYMLP